MAEKDQEKKNLNAKPVENEKTAEPVENKKTAEPKVEDKKVTSKEDTKETATNNKEEKKVIASKEEAKETATKQAEEKPITSNKDTKKPVEKAKEEKPATKDVKPSSKTKSVVKKEVIKKLVDKAKANPTINKSAEKTKTEKPVAKKTTKPAKKVTSADKKLPAVKKETKPATVKKADKKSNKPVVIDTTLTTTTAEKAKDKKPKENALVRSYRENKRAWKDALVVVGALALFGVGFGLGHATTGNNPTIAVISKGHGANHKVKQQDIDHQLNNTHYAHSIANQQLTLKALATLYPKQYDKYTQKAQKYIKAQQRTYGGAKNYQQVLAANNSSEADVINNYLLTQMITVSVMHHNEPTKADLQKLYKKTDNNAYKLSGVLVRTKDQAQAVEEGIRNGSSYTSMKNKINKNDFAYFNRSTPDMKNSMTLQELNDLDNNLADGVSQMKKGQTAIIKNGSKNYFVITLKDKTTQSFKSSQSRLKTKYVNNLMLNGYGPIQKALKADYKRAGVKVKDTKQFNDIAQVQNFYSNGGFNAPSNN